MGYLGRINRYGHLPVMKLFNFIMNGPLIGGKVYLGEGGHLGCFGIKPMII